MISFLREVLSFGREIYGDIKKKKDAGKIKREAQERLIVMIDKEKARQALKERLAK